MGAVGSSADNAAAESFNAAFKRETLKGRKAWPSEREARLDAFRWLTRYNTRRRHSRLGHRSPIAYENDLQPAATTLTQAAKTCSKSGARPLDLQHTSGPAGAARYTLRLLARRTQHLTGEIDDLNKRIGEAVEASTPGLLEVRGVGPDSAAALLISAGDNPERLVSEASFAALCGTSPVEASSGKTQRRRLNLGGDRQANAALYRIVLSRLRWDERIRDYLQRRLTEGKTRREIIRCLKRYVAREIYRHLVPADPLAGQSGPAVLSSRCVGSPGLLWACAVSSRSFCRQIQQRS
jgi:hypothetical protein